MCVNKKLNPYWVTGFVDGEGCFSISFTKRLYRKIKVEIRPSFSVTQLPESKHLLKELQQFFNCGSIRFSRHDGFYKYEVRSLNDLHENIIPHFNKYILISPKKENFEIFQRICFSIKSNKYKNPETLKSIIKMAYEMNKQGKRKYLLDDLLKLIAS